jgi:hypothetical protein
VDVQSHLNCTTACNHKPRLKCPLYHTKRIVDGPLDLISHHLIGTTKNYRRSTLVFEPFEEDEIIIA